MWDSVEIVLNLAHLYDLETKLQLEGGRNCNGAPMFTRVSKTFLLQRDELSVTMGWTLILGVFAETCQTQSLANKLRIDSIGTLKSIVSKEFEISLNKYTNPILGLVDLNLNFINT